MFEDKMLPSNIFKVHGYHTLPVAQCAELCRMQNHVMNTTCQSFELVGTQTCILSNISAWMTSRNGYDIFVPAPGARYYELSKGHLNLFTRFPGFVFRNDSKYNRLLNMSSAEECAEACVMTSELSCNSFAYSQSNRVCGLSADVIRSPNDLKKVKNYDMFEYSGDWPCNVTLPWGYSPRVISSSRYPFYPKLNKTCTFNLVAPARKSIVITLRSLIINSYVCSERKSGMFIYDGDSDQSNLLLGICRNSPGLVMSSLKSSGNVFMKIITLDSPFVIKLTYDYTDHDACDGHQCKNGGLCVPNNQSYSCTCSKEFSGPFCETDIIDSCQSNPCIFGNCLDKFHGYDCQCYKDVTGQRCETYLGGCSRKPCKYGDCVPMLSGYRCECAAGYTGSNCEYEVNECFSSPCGAHGRCIDRVNNYTCLCDRDHTGRNCHVSKFQKSCTGYECKYGTCAVNESGSFCQCFPGFTGSSCGININECSSSPCGPHGQCVDHVNGYSCQCSHGWYGVHCSISRSDSCRNSNCIHGYCSVISPDGDYKCVCETNYTGSQCSEIITPCSPNPCASGVCIEIGSNFECKCHLGHGGRYCDNKLSYCENNSCIHGQCVEGTANYTCLCDREWIGNLCDVKGSPCADVNCNFGKCVETWDNVGFECVCNSNYIGKFCEFIKNPCLSLPCLENGTCIPNGSLFVCQCASHRTGRLCEYLINHCGSSPCVSGRCFNHFDSYMCLCDAFHTGRNCQNILSFLTSTETKQITSEGIQSTSKSNPNPTMVASSEPICTGINSTTQTGLSLKSVTEMDPCKMFACTNGKCILSSGIGGPVCLCDNFYTGRFCDTPVKDYIIYNLINNTVNKRHNESSLCENITCIKGKCFQYFGKTVCLCGQNDSRKECDMKMDIVTFTTTTSAIDTKSIHLDVTSGNQPSHAKITAINLHIGDKVTDASIPNHAEVAGENKHNPTTVTDVNNHNHVEMTVGNEQNLVEATVANKLNATEMTDSNKHHHAEVITDNKHNLSTVTYPNNLKQTEVTDEIFTNINCSRNTCEHGECKVENRLYKCNCKAGFVGKFCNISLHSANESFVNNSDESGRTIEYVAIVALCLCLLLFMLAGGVWWYKRVKRQRGSLYIRNPSDFETNDTNSYTTEEDLSEQSGNTVREKDSKQRKPIIRCAWYLSSGNSDCSEDSRQGNKYADVNIDIREQTEPIRNELFDVSQKPVVNGVNKTAMDPSDHVIQVNRGVKSASTLPYRPILIRPPDKRYHKCPGFQTIDGVQEEKSDV